ncbi:hypothetical protein [sulfur-oxidizing endosymbiont of Gigantopelta aegis]|uniref:hypothetical protein n=1 Tax=sulfur-oxidizing endosymbiont of Gigantopelta aegis TaxID=2794934 RepID=UPI001FE34EE8|nr:hypothetical protein [sulfur-oxidizing endosymbiont of Gigantopelta aegis]
MLTHQPIESPSETAQDSNIPKDVQKDSQHFETVIIGTGFSGLLAAIRLQKSISMTLSY